MNKKNSLRTFYKSKRDSLDPSDIEAQSIKITNHLIELPIWEKTYYHLFLTINRLKEVDTSFILTLLQGRDKDIVVSKSNFEKLTLAHFLLSDSTRLKVNTWGIPEPVDGIEVPVSKIQVVFVPLLAFDVSGNRVGYGKGFYDRFLKSCNPDTIKIGLSFFEAENLIEGIHDGDAPLDYCVTPEKIYRF